MNENLKCPVKPYKPKGMFEHSQGRGKQNVHMQHKPWIIHKNTNMKN